MRGFVLLCAASVITLALAWGASYLRISYAHDRSIVWLTSGSLIYQSDAMVLIRERDAWCTQRLAELDAQLARPPVIGPPRMDAGRPEARRSFMILTRQRISRMQRSLRSARSIEIAGFDGLHRMTTLWRPQFDGRIILPLWIPMVMGLSGVAVYMWHRRSRRSAGCCVRCGLSVRDTSGWCGPCDVLTHPCRHTETIVMAAVLLLMGGIVAWCAAQVWRPRGYTVLATIHLIDTIIAGLAIGLLIALPRRRTVPAGFCERCGYDVRGAAGPCPECGADGHLIAIPSTDRSS